MTWLETLNQIFQIAIVPLLVACTLYLIALINAKKKELKAKTENQKAHEYLDLLDKTISECVIATTQTYVKALKNKNAFDIEAQKEALNKTYNAVMSILTADAKEYLEKVVGDLNEYILNKIESEVAVTKKVYF